MENLRDFISRFSLLSLITAPVVSSILAGLALTHVFKILRLGLNLKYGETPDEPNHSKERLGGAGDFAQILIHDQRQSADIITRSEVRSGGLTTPSGQVASLISMSRSIRARMCCPRRPFSMAIAQIPAPCPES